MYIYQPFRNSLRKQIGNHASVVHGKVLDVGAGSFDRYSGLFTYDSYARMDIKGTANVDVYGVAEDIPFPDESFDSIVCTQVLEDTKDPKKALAEMHRTLKKGGVLLLTTGFLAPICGDPTDSWRFTDYGLQKLFTEASFEVKDHEPVGGFWGVMVQSFMRHLTNKYDIYHRWYRSPFSFLVKIVGKFADRLDRNGDNLFAHGFLIIGEKI